MTETVSIYSKRRNRQAKKIKSLPSDQNALPEDNSRVVSIHTNTEHIRSPTGYGVRRPEAPSDMKPELTRKQRLPRQKSIFPA